MMAGYTSVARSGQLRRRTQGAQRRLVRPSDLLAPVLLVVILPLAIVGSKPSNLQQLSGVMIVMIVVVSGASLSSVVSRGAFEPAAFSAYMFFYVWFGLAPLAQLVGDSIPLVTPFLGEVPSKSSFENGGSLIALLGLCAMRFGFARPFWRKGAVGLDKIEPNRLNLLRWSAVPAIAAGVLLLGGPQLLITPRSGSLELAGVTGTSSLAIVGIARALMRAPILVAVVATELLRRTRDARDFGGGLLRWTLLLSLALVANPLVFPRFWSGAVAVSLVFLIIRDASPFVRRRAMLGIVLLAVILLPYADTFRRGFNADFEVVSVSRLLAEDGTYSAYGQSILGTDYVHNEGHTYGTQTVGALLFFVPRSVWASKAGDTGDLIGEGVGLPARLNPSAPLPVEAFVEFGWIGVILVMFASGRVFGEIDRRAKVEQQGNTVARWSIIAVILPAYLPYVLRGSLLASIPLATVLVVVIMALTSQSRAQRLNEVTG